MKQFILFVFVVLSFGIAKAHMPRHAAHFVPTVIPSNNLSDYNVTFRFHPKVFHYGKKEITSVQNKIANTVNETALKKKKVLQEKTRNKVD